jgi:hypothetical protein
MSTTKNYATSNSASNPLPARTGVLRRIGAAALGTGIGAVTLVALLLAGVAGSMVETSMPSDSGGSLSVPSSNGPIVVAVVLGQSGTDAADALAPYEVFARSSQFSVYTVASTSEPVPLNGGLNVLPAYTFDDSADGTAPEPDLLVVPAVNDPAGDNDGTSGWTPRHIALVPHQPAREIEPGSHMGDRSALRPGSRNHHLRGSHLRHSCCIAARAAVGGRCGS